MGSSFVQPMREGFDATEIFPPKLIEYYKFNPPIGIESYLCVVQIAVFSATTLPFASIIFLRYYREAFCSEARPVHSRKPFATPHSRSLLQGVSLQQLQPSNLSAKISSFPGRALPPSGDPVVEPESRTPCHSSSRGYTPNRQQISSHLPPHFQPLPFLPWYPDFDGEGQSIAIRDLSLPCSSDDTLC
jgi:hypothetical protein